jgi:hypothetical protein
LGGGGNGGRMPTNFSAVRNGNAGSTNMGGGGGGGSIYGSFGAAGGSGIVIIRYTV